MPKFMYKGYSLEELQKMSIEEFAKITTSRIRRTLLRRLKLGFPPEWEKFFRKIKLQLEGKYKRPVRTHIRMIPILPFMVGAKVAVYNGKEYVEFEIKPEMIGYRLGDFSHTTQKVKHSAPGVGATRSTKHLHAK